jgi:D-beta-D-heptose 7-phosphate kinase / D-beta-D-heptose 1-phosphate adenosyltransferase
VDARTAVAEGFSGQRALVVGDVMLDRYLVGEVRRISPEAPVAVVRLGSESQRVGGAGNVALNLAGLGIETNVAGFTGADENGRRALVELQRAGVDSRYVVPVSGYRTTTKTRVLSRHQQLIRIDDEDMDALSGRRRADFDQEVASLVSRDLSVIVLSDYAKGVISDALCIRIIQRARVLGIPVLVDPKGIDYRKYRGATLVTPNESELLAACRLPSMDLAAEIAAAGELLARLAFGGVAITRGERGITLVTENEVCSAPARARDVFDVSGAGDTVAAVLAGCVAVGVAWQEAIELANAAAGVTIAKTGATPITREELLKEWNDGSVRSPGQLDEKLRDLAELRVLVETWRAAGDVVAFTNGCFDLLHAGHVRYLDWSRQHCDRLIVGVNSDASVHVLKGRGRPIVSEQDRALVLAALTSVDAVIVFDEVTPLSVVTALRPDVLIKGSDYEDREVIGAAEVRGWGGDVLFAPIVNGQSTTAIFDHLRAID